MRGYKDLERLVLNAAGSKVEFGLWHALRFSIGDCTRPALLVDRNTENFLGKDYDQFMVPVEVGVIRNMILSKEVGLDALKDIFNRPWVSSDLDKRPSLA